MSSLASIPQVAKVLESPALKAVRELYPPRLIVDAIRRELQQLRERLRAGESAHDTTAEGIAFQVQVQLARLDRPQLRTVINATGIALHTNLGRSPMHEDAAQAAYRAARGYLNLELDLESGERSSRQNPIREGVMRITGAEAATVVNNCAAATVIVLRALAVGKEVIVSRGQLIEIGGSFRIPDIMVTSGAILREVGTTNITRLADYERAIGPNTGMILRVHTSNYRIRGFTQSTSIEDLVRLGQQRGIPVVDDAGSGSVIDLSPFGLPGEPRVDEGIRAGADLVLFSGDKLLGGPQAGIIAGKHSLIQRIDRDPLMRAFRLDKMTLAALEATLHLYRDPARALREIPTLRMLATPLDELTQRCHSLAARLQAQAEIEVQIRPGTAFVGGGSLPDIELPTCLIALRSPQLSEEEFARRLRTGTPAVMARVHAGQVLLDLRTVFAEQESDLLTALHRATISETPTP